MVALKAARTAGAPEKNERANYRARYDFSKDGGATGSYDLFVASTDCLVTNFHAVVKSEVTGNNATMKVGTASDDDLLMSALQAGMGANTVHKLPLAAATPDVVPCPVRLAEGEKLIMKIGGAAITAGVVEYVIETMAD